MILSHKSWWHELNTWEPELALDFYGRTLGWKFEASALPDGGSYWIAHHQGRTVGGIFELRSPDCEGIPSHWMTYMAVPDINEAERLAAESGGEIIRTAFDVPGVGKLAVASDATGALIGLIEPEGSGMPVLRH